MNGTNEAAVKQRFADELERVRVRSLGLTTDVLDTDAPGLSKRTPRVLPASYKPRSNRLPAKREKTLWKKGS